MQILQHFQQEDDNMKYASYTGTIRNNLCELLTSQRDIREKIIKLNESIKVILSVPSTDQPANAGLIVLELHRTIEFFEKINSDYESEIMRLTKILLDKQP